MSINRFSTRAAALAAIALLVPLVASSAASAPNKDRPRASTSTPTAVATGSPVAVAPSAPTAPNARMAALVRAGGGLVRRSGVKGIARIDTGVYCIAPKPETGIDVNRAIVLVSPEYFYSELDEISVVWASTQNGCAEGRFGIYTLADPNQDGVYSFSNAVGFSVYVP